MVELSEAAFSRAVSLCGQMVEELREGRPLWDEQEAAFTMELMTLVYRESPDSYWKPFDTRARELIYKAQRYVADHYAENIGLESLAAALFPTCFGRRQDTAIGSICFNTAYPPPDNCS